MDDYSEKIIILFNHFKYKRSIYMRKLSFLFIIIGISIISYSIFQLVQSNMKQNESLAKAKEFIQLNNNDVERSTPIDDLFSPKTGDTVGILDIEKIDAELPIVEGTDEDELEIGVGHYKDTVYPTQNDQILLSGHRDTVFRRMGELEIGDTMTIKLPYGDFTYEIYETFIVDADDTTVIKSTAPDEVLTVSTCYPFQYVGSAPDRYIINAKPIY